MCKFGRLLSLAFAVVPNLVKTVAVERANTLRRTYPAPEQHLAAFTGWQEFSNMVRDRLDQDVKGNGIAKEYSVRANVSSTTNTSYPNPKDLQLALRMSPETYASYTAFFRRLDTDSNGMLHEVEFVAALDGRRDIKVAGQDVFLHFAPGGMMSPPEFLRCAMIMLAKPSDFHWSEEDLKHLPTWKVWQEQDRLALLKLLLVFDVNIDGKVSMVEFESGWMGPLLWKLRQEDMISREWMENDDEFEYASKVFDQRSGDDLQLDLTEWVHLLYESRDEYRKFHSGCSAQYHAGSVCAIATAMTLMSA